ncbi:MAG: translocation/assembly module TamB domain-containing protein [Deltaproteobacteria bacterium]|nr:translocation/assembly module TamB domain-containing protein [Deltaproteobacteria bacterium]
MRQLGRALLAVLRLLGRVIGGLLLGTYLLVSRSLVVILALYLVVYFLAASRPMKGLIQQAVSDAIPGTIGAASIQWGPLPWHVRIAEARVLGDRGEEVIRCRGIEATVDLGDTLESLFALVTDPDVHALKIHLKRVDLLEPWARVEVTDTLVGLERALVPRDDPNEPPSTGPPFVFGIHSDVVRVIDGGSRVDAPGFLLEANGVDAVTDFTLVSTPFDMRFDVPRADVPHVDLRFTTFPHLPGALAFAANDLQVDDFRWRHLGFAWRAAAGILGPRFAPHGRFEGAGHLDAAPSPVTFGGEGRLVLPDGSPLLAALSLDTVRGPLTATIAARGNVEQLRAAYTFESDELAAGPLLLDALTVQGRIEPIGTADIPDRHALLIDHAEAHYGAGQVTVDGLSWSPRVPDATERDLAMQVAVADLDVGAALESLLGAAFPGPGGRPTSFPTASWTGRATLALRARPAAELGPGMPDAAASDGPFVDHWDAAWDLDLEPTRLLFGRAGPPLGPFFSPSGQPAWVVSGRVTRRLAASGLLVPSRAGPNLVAPVDFLHLEGFMLDAGQDRARVAGDIDLVSGALDLEPYLRIGDLALATRLLRTLGAPSELRAAGALPDLGGRLVVKAAHAGGTLAAPELSATINWTQARMGERELGQVKGTLSLSGRTLSLSGFTSKSGLGDFALDGHVDLRDIAAKPASFSLRGRKIDGLLASALGPWLGADARVSVVEGEVHGAVADPIGSLAGSGTVIVTHASIGGEPGIRVAARVTVRPGLALQIEDLRMTLADGTELTGRLRTSALHASGTMPVPNPSLEGRLEVGDLSIANLAPLARALPGLSAILRGRLTLAGTLAHPIVIGTVDIDDAVIGRLALGDARLAITTSDDQLEVSAFDNDFFPGFSLEHATLDLFDKLDGRRFPGRLAATVRARKKNLGELFPELASDAFELVGSAAAEVAIEPSGQASLKLRAAPGDLAIHIPDRAARWVNTTELLVVTDPRPGQERLVRLHPTTLAPVASAGAVPSVRPEIEACGTLDLDRIDTVDAAGQKVRNLDDALRLQLAGSLDFALVPGLANVFSVSDGRLVIAHDPVASRSVGDDTCLQNAPDLLYIRGQPTSPVILGRLDARGVVLVPRGSGREIRLRDGASVLLREGRVVGTQRILLGADGTRFGGDLDDGTFSLSGDLIARAFRLLSLDLAVEGTDLFIQSAGEFAISASPSVRLRALGLDSPEPELWVSGDVPISDGRFSKSFDTFARAVGGALGGRADAYSTSLIDELPWVGRARLDLNVTAADFQIQTALPLARTDLRSRLDLTVRGTVAEPRLFRRIDLLAGGTLTYLLFERTFVVNQGAVDFDGDPERPLIEVTAQTAITYVQRAQTALQEEDQKEVTVVLRMSGRVPDLKIELSSDDPTLGQADLQSLLLTGRPRGDLDRAEENRLVSADLASVINAVLSAPFVRTASVGLDQKGSLEYRVGTCFAPNLCFDTTTVSDDTETRLRARFSLSIGDDLVCEGTLRRSEGGARTDDDAYEARCRYRIPLE